MYLIPGTLLQGGKYKIVRFIASGGFGCTYEAQHLMLDKKVAIKEFFPKSLCNRDPETSQISVGTQSQIPLVKKLKDKFVNEAVSIAKLSHSGIVKVTDVFEENGTAYYVMDYIEGKSLGDIINEKGQLSEEEVLGYIRQVADALSYVHSKNRLHLDIKPGNIMIGPNGEAVLIDFGTSKQYDEENGENSSTLIGNTPGYAPIEQMGNDVHHFRPATDIYALGATLYKCLSGKTPLQASLLAQGEELDPLPSNVNNATKKAIDEAMRISPKKRPQTVAEFLSILDDRKASKDSNVTNKVVEENTIFGPLGSSNTPKPSSGSSHNFGQAFPGSAPKEKSQSKNPSISNTDLFKDFIPAGPMPFKSDVLEESSDRDEIVDNPILGKEVPFKDSKDSKDKDSKVTSGAFISNPFVPSSANKKSEEVQFPSSPIPSRSDLINESPSSKDAFQDKNQNPFKPEAQKFDTSSATKTSGQEPLPFNTQSSVPSNKTAHQPKTVAPNEVKVEAPSQPFGFPSFVPSDKKDSQQVSGASKVPNQPKVETPLTTNNTPSTPSSTSIPSTTSTPSTTPNLSNEHPLPSNQSADSASKTTSTFKSPFGDNPQPAQPVVDEYDYDDEEKSSKSKIYIGIAVAAIIALVCWFAFGGKKSETSNPNEEGDQLALVEDSIENTIEQVVVNGPALTVVPPTNVKVGEEFKVIFRLSEGKGKDFKAKDINGLEKISGPEEVKTKKGVDYTFTYKAEKEGIYSIPIATIKVDGKSLSSKSRKFSVKAGQGTNIVEEQFAPVEKEQVLAVTTGNINGHEWVDLGLPSGTKWATTNIGATQPEQYGGYYTWGETKSKSTFDQDNCETFGKDDAWLKENGFIGGSGNLSLSHDPARQTWGGTWRLPTLNEIKELKSNTTTEWITSNGVHGCLVKSKKNDNSIFLPAAGWRLGPTLYNGGTIGYYLTSTPYSSEPYGVYYIEFDWNTFMATWGGRHSGRSVRPVSD